MDIARIMSTVMPGTFAPDVAGSEAPQITPIPALANAPADFTDAASTAPQSPSISALSGQSSDTADAAALAAGTTVPSVSGETSFKDTVKALLSDVNTKMNTADQNTRDLADGKTNDTNKVVTSVEEANLALQYTLAIREKLLQAYTSVQQMTV